MCCPAGWQVGFHPWPAPRPAPCLGILPRVWAVDSEGLGLSERVLLSPCSGQVSVSLSTTPVSGPGLAQHQLGRAAAKSRILGSLWTPCCPRHRDNTHSLTRGATPSTEPPTCPGRPKPIQPRSPNATLTLEATHLQKNLVGGEFKASPGGIQSAWTRLLSSPGTSGGQGSRITISAIALRWLVSLPWHFRPPQRLLSPQEGVAESQQVPSSSEPKAGRGGWKGRDSDAAPSFQLPK